ncbi:hypothetical protein QQ045_002222 [Rhodiola kirilowii]
METERVVEFPIVNIDKRPRKRQRLGWDVMPMYFYGHEDSPPWRKDDKDGHYTFSIGDNLTPRFMHDMHLIHTDLKPETILLVSSDYVRFPTTRLLHALPKTTHTARGYQNPVPSKSLGWSYPCDIWIVGCMSGEFCTGEALFQTHENLAMMERVLGASLQKSMSEKDS